MPVVIFAPERGQRVPVLLWAPDAAPATVRQLQSIAARPYAIHHVAAMPDAHVSDGVAVGTVFATRDAVVPGALGGDLGCGVSALCFPAPASFLGPRELRGVLDSLARVVPVGDAAHPARPAEALPEALRACDLSTHALCRMRDTLAPRHLGTLGGGNHFLELDRDAGGDLWIMVHSGSRGVGSAVAAHHRRAADAAHAAHAAHGGTPDPLAALPVHSVAGRAYLNDLEFSLSFARANREAVLSVAAAVLADALGVAPDFASRIDAHHNFVACEHHRGEALWVHRKGAIAAGPGQPGIIPGSMGTASYLVRGLGSDASFHSCSHGAGRVLTRREARARIAPAALARAMGRVLFAGAPAKDLVEEAPAAYRDIRAVLAAQRDLVEPVLRLEPIAVLKG